MATHYEVLGVTRTATAAQIKRAYYAKARAYHPDGHAGSTSDVLKEAERSMAALNAAWNVLRRDRLRVQYDRNLQEDSTDEPSRKAAPLAPGSGIRYFMGTSSVVKAHDGIGHRVNLLVESDADLSSLRTLAPDGVYALHCRGAAVDDPQLAHIGELTGLQLLDLSRTRVTDVGLLHLSRLTQLEHLWLWDTALTDAGLAIVGRLPALRFLGLGNTQITDAGLAGISDMTELRVLQLVGTGVTGRGLEHLHRMISLERVTLPWRVRGRDRRRLKSALPNATVA